MSNVQTLLLDNQDSLLPKANVIGVAVGHKWTNGQSTGEEALLVLVSQKVPLNQLKPEDIIPPIIDGVKTDVVGKCGFLRPHADTARYRPIPAGVSTGHLWVTAGTLGGWFTDRSGDIVALSNNHVLAAENRGLEGHLAFQPGIYDAPKWGSWRGLEAPFSQYPYYGQLKGNYVRLQNTGNVQDSAIARVAHPSLAWGTILEIGTPTGFRDDVPINLSVMKRGRTTRLTHGKVIGIHATVQVWYDDGILTFEDQVITTGMSAGGDSGSLGLDGDRKIWGLLYAGSDTITVFNYIKYPRESYGLSIYTAVPPPPPAPPPPPPKPPKPTPKPPVKKKPKRFNRR